MTADTYATATAVSAKAYVDFLAREAEAGPRDPPLSGFSDVVNASEPSLARSTTTRTFGIFERTTLVGGAER